MSEPEDFYDDFYDEEDYEDDPVEMAFESGDLPCDYGYCGPECPYWGGDGLCDLAIEEQTKQWDEYYSEHVKESACPVCGKKLKLYEVKADELWVWDPGWYDPMIGLEVYSAAWVPKGVVHEADNVYHVWIGDGENRTERLIKLIKR